MDPKRCAHRRKLLDRNLQSADKTSLATLISEIKALGIPVKGVISADQRSIRLAVKHELPGTPHQLCRFHFLCNTARPICEMDRALKVDLKKKVRGIKPVEQNASYKTDKPVDFQVLLSY